MTSNINDIYVLPNLKPLITIENISKEVYETLKMKLLEIVMKDCQEAKLGRETVKLTLSLMMNQKLRLKIFGF